MNIVRWSIIALFVTILFSLLYTLWTVVSTI